MAIVMVTGANRGIGFGLTKAYLARGDIVVGTYRDNDRSQELLSMATRMRDDGDERLFPVVMEVRDAASIDACYEQNLLPRRDSAQDTDRRRRDRRSHCPAGTGQNTHSQSQRAVF